MRESGVDHDGLRLDLEMTPPRPSPSENCVSLQTEFPDDGNEAVEIVSVPAEDATLLRLARRGDVVYQVVQNSEQTAPVILGALHGGRGAVSAGALKMLVCTGGAGRVTSIQFRTMKQWAEKLIE